VDVLTLPGFLSWQKALICQTRGYCCWWEITPSANLPFMKRIFVGWLSVSWSQNCWDHYGWWPLLLGKGEITVAEGLHVWGRQAMPLLNFTLAFTLQLRKRMENLSWVIQVVKDCLLRQLGCLLRGSLDWPAEHQFTSVTHGGL
jgi:hypothetical protein